MEQATIFLAPELAKARRRRRLLIVFGGTLLVAGIVTGVYYRDAWSWVQGLRSRRLAAKAEADLIAGRIEDAASKAKEAYQMKPTEPPSIRIAARVQGLVGQPALAAALWKQLAEAGTMTSADRRQYAEALLNAGMVLDAARELDSMLATSRDDPAFRRLVARLHATRGDFQKAILSAREAVTLDRENPEGRLLLGVLLAGSKDAPLREEGVRILLKLGAEGTREGSEALKRISVLPNLQPEVVREIIGLLRAHPLATEEHRLQALALEIFLRPGEKDALLDAAVKHYRNAEPAAKCAAGVWLNNRRESARALEVVPMDEGFKRKDMLLVCLDALAALERWDEIERILAMKDAPLDTAFKELFLARSAIAQNSQTVADLHWKRALLAAGPSVEQMRVIAAYAEKIGRYDQAETALNSLAASASTARFAHESLLRLARRQGKAAAIRDILMRMRQRWPKDDAVKNDLAFIHALLGESLDDALASARELVAASPLSFQHRSTLALALLRKGDASGALAVYHGQQIPWERVDPSQRAVHAAVLGANGRTDEARAEAAAIKWDMLRPEEQELIKQWRTP